MVEMSDPAACARTGGTGCGGKKKKSAGFVGCTELARSLVIGLGSPPPMLIESPMSSTSAEPADGPSDRAGWIKSDEFVQRPLGSQAGGWRHCHVKAHPHQHR